MGTVERIFRHILLSLFIVAIAISLVTDTSVSSQNAQQIVTLYAYDPLVNTLSLQTGNCGHVIQNWGAYNMNSDIDFNGYYERISVWVLKVVELVESWILAQPKTFHEFMVIRKQ